MKNMHKDLMDRYNEFIRSLELVDMYISDLNFKRFGDIPEREELPIKVTIKPTKNEYKVVETTRHEISHRVLFKLEYIEQEQRRAFFELKATYKLIYRSNYKLDDEIFKIFVKRNIPVNVIPFLRETVYNSMYRAGLQPILIPLMKPESSPKRAK